MHPRHRKYIFAVLLLALLLPSSSFAQSRRLRNRDRNKGVEIEQVPDSVRAQRDSIRKADSLKTKDSLDLLSKSSLRAPAFSDAGDSIVEDFSNGQRKIYYYGGVTVKYENMQLTADYMEYDMSTGIVYARGTLDTLTGEWKGRPEMTQGATSYTMDELKYNFDTRKAIIQNMTTQDNEGTLKGRDIKMLPDNSINISGGQYTVCDAEEPHYYLKLLTAKVMTKPSQKTVFGPAFPVIGDVTIPIGLPFGFIPKRPERATGLLMPTFGEETARGFYMRDAGMYFVIGDFFDISLTGDYYTLGSWALDVNSRYKVNYKFNGSLGLTISNDQTGEKDSPDFFQTRNFQLKWTHSQDSKAHPGSSFSASVNFSSPSSNRYNSRSINEAIQNQTSSSISYSHNWGGKVNLSMNALHSQSSRDSSYSFTLPNVTLSVSTFYPFKKKNRVGKEKIYEKISFGYNTSLQNKVNFKMSDFMVKQMGTDGNVMIDPDTGSPARQFSMDSLITKLPGMFSNGMQHNFQIGLPTFTLLKYFTFNPSVSYGQNWFFRTADYEYNPVTDKVEQKLSDPFSTLGITHNYSAGISMSTRLYGTFNFGKNSKMQAIRHIISPSMSLSLSPEKGTYANGWRTYNYTDKSGNQKSYDYNIYSIPGGNSPPGKGKSATASFQIGNNLEAKVKNPDDTTGTGLKKIKLIDQLNLSSGYNFLADSLRMSDVGLTMSTNLLEKINVTANANFSPYAINERGEVINQYSVVKNGFKQLLRLTRAGASISYSINGKGALEGNDGSSGSAGSSSSKGGASGAASSYQRIYYHPVTGEYIPGGWLYYTNPNAPWSLNFSYILSYARNYQYSNEKLTTKNDITQTLGITGNLKLTPRMALNFNTGFDIMAGRLTSTQISATYDLHCFNIAVSWVPSGKWQSYTFRIAANAATLADLLKFKKSSSYWDN